MKRDLAYLDSPSRCCTISCINVIMASSVDRFAWYANCNLSMAGCMWVVMLDNRALSKHLANIAIKVTGQRSLSTLGSGFSWTGTISPIFHRAGIRSTHCSIELKMVWMMGTRLVTHCLIYDRLAYRAVAFLVFMLFRIKETSLSDIVIGVSFTSSFSSSVFILWWMAEKSLLFKRA